MKNLPEVFGSFNINKYKQPVTTTKEEIKVEQKKIESPDNSIFFYFQNNNKVNIMTKD